MVKVSQGGAPIARDHRRSGQAEPRAGPALGPITAIGADAIHDKYRDMLEEIIGKLRRDAVPCGTVPELYARGMTMVEPPPLEPLDGAESFVGLDATVQDFWRFALPSLITNNTRGWFVEYLVWRALGIERPVRTEWDAFDVEWEGIRIEVKASAFVQRWAQRGPSKLVFSGLRGKLLDPTTGTYATEPPTTLTSTCLPLIAHATMTPTVSWTRASGPSPL